VYAIQWLTIMRQRTLNVVVMLLLGASLRPRARPQHADLGAVYFIAATPGQPDSPTRYSAALYAVGQQRKLLLVRQFFTADQRFVDFADDLHGRVYLAGGTGIFIVHQDDPAREDFVPLDSFDDFPCWGAVNGDGVPAGVQYCVSPEIKEIPAKREPGQPSVVPGNWARFKYLQYGGENGGPFQMLPPLAEIAGVSLVMPYAFRPDVTLAQLPPELKTDPAKQRRVVCVLAATDRYLVLWAVPDYMIGHSVGSSNLDHAEPLQLFVLDRSKDKWRTVEVPTAVTSFTHPPIRVFNDWMVTTTMNWRPAASGSGSPGRENERLAESDSAKPSIQTRYSYEFVGLYIPGKLVIQNLRDDRKFTLATGQEDSEVIAIRPDGTIFYRINDSVYAARITGNQLTAPTLIARDDDVPEIHWAFWGPGMKSGQSSASPDKSH
jgi:hypothetical protein